MESSIFFQTRKGNQYLYDRNKAYLVSVPPIMEQIYLTDTASNTDNESLLKRVMKKNLTLPPNEVEYEVKRYLFFKSNGFFSNFNSKELISARLTPQVVEQQLTSLHSILFQVTNKCNLRCKYCCYGEFYENTSPLKNLDIEIVNKLFNYMLPYWISKKTLTHQPTIRIGFYGGEPLFNFHLVQQIVEICERIKCCYSVNFQYTMTTNAVLLDKYMDYLVGHNFTLLLSLDGNRVHNYLRVDAQGKESFDKVYQNIKKLQQLHSDYFDKNVDFNSVLNNKSSTDEVQSFILSEFGKQPTISSISFTGVKRERIEEVKEIYKDYKESIDTLTKRGSKSPYWGELSYFLFSQFSNSFKHYHEIYRAKRIERKYPTGTCLPFMKKIFVTTEGNLLPCERICHNYIIGKVTDKVHINCEQIADMYNQYYDEISKQCCECYHINECKECFMQSQIIDNKIVCGSKMNKQEYKSYLSILISLLEENPDLFDSVNKMIFT